ncbi:hypothetical protein LJ655_11240 [Paraburkholderia sp. MMS20-SJTN17]|uniref:Uncharacterized protein n=1 Tax=Paraburkholderia translucens TaxID=2886945 RepID=A0ABS8KCG9_9BURK|nr:hypothetical protein [Paraburkholderia sp. MMS20-SJTN17]MCC8402461.1 hypothetical protein [Paraburkholderia sp. MMS20-SJTN17]
MTVQTARCNRFDRVMLLLLALFCMSETPLEMLVSESPAEIVAVLVAKAAWTTLVAATLLRRRLAARLLAFACAVSAVAVSLTLPDLARTFPFAFSVLSVEVLLKLLVFVRTSFVPSGQTAAVQQQALLN